MAKKRPGVRPGNIRVPRRRISRKVLAGIVLSVLLLAPIAVFFVVSRNLPSVGDLEHRRVRQSTKLYDREGQTLLYEVSEGEKRTVIPFEDIPQAIKDATIAVEDEKFYEAPAFDWRAIIRAGLVNLTHGKILQGGSTITQQLAKNAFLSPEQTYSRKLRELVLAVELNRRYTKDQILGFYLNEVPYGPNLYGIEAASRAYFGKSAKGLVIAESALLAAIPRAPSYYSPWGTHREELIRRQQFILRKMARLQKIDEAELEEALGHALVFVQQESGIRAPHFVIAAQEYLVKKYGEDLVRSGGLVVRTTLDVRLQEAAELAVKEGAERNENLYGGTNAALVAEDATTGQILALVGSRDYFNVEREGNFNVATQGLRQPGSALKPFVYLAAFERGYAPETAVFDVPTEFTQSCPELPDTHANIPQCFHPENFDGRFRGPVTFRQALAQSINVPAVKVLYLVGLPGALETLKQFGITTLSNPSRYGLSLVLGGGEVRLAELVSAYATLAQDGMRRPQTIILEVKDGEGNTLESYRERAESVINPQYPRVVNDILADQEARGGLFGGSLPLTVFPGHDVALKTGTSNDYRDAWAVGYTPSLVAGVWAGNNDNAPMHKQGSSILAALPIWNAFMTKALEGRLQEPFTRPETAFVKPELRGVYVKDGELHTILYYIDRTNPLGGAPENPLADPQFSHWEFGIREWATANPPPTHLFFENQTVVGEATPGQLPHIVIHSPRAGDFVQNADALRLEMRISSPSSITEIRISVNDQLVKSMTGNFGTAYELSTAISVDNLAPQNLLEVEVVNQNGARDRKSVIVYG